MNIDVTPSVRRRVDAQGFLRLDDHTIGQLNCWLRLSPAICMIWAGIGTAMQSATVFGILAPLALLAALLQGTHLMRFIVSSWDG